MTNSVLEQADVVQDLAKRADSAVEAERAALRRAVRGRRKVDRRDARRVRRKRSRRRARGAGAEADHKDVDGEARGVSRVARPCNRLGR